ncbi:hypothetical protein OV090_24815 [Nannocystis sp. RBIL2]|uniref:hypothetical protein n=1 Tax=Nannocystis sp. RBIL2 TaxID=2996788 RepID=UPI002271048B|nr:hypothetical protein [Nannocystis sp. RBIL2]MCY1067988.1 hypothetical protein [Nannocystis sp. RBIL2]
MPRQSLVVPMLLTSVAACTSPQYAIYQQQHADDAGSETSASNDTRAETSSDSPLTSSETSSTAETGAAGTTQTDGDATAADSASTGASTGDDGKAVPVAVEVFLEPSPVTEVGPVQVSVSTSRPVASIDIFLKDENKGDVPLVLGAAPGNPVHVFEVTSEDVPGDGMHTIRAVAHAADGVSGESSEALLIDVQPGGSDVWPPYVKAGPINGFTSAALRGNGIDVAGYFETNDGLEAVAVRVDGTTGQPEGGPVLLGPVAVTGGGRGPAIAAAGDDAAFVAWTQPANGSTRWAVSRVKFGEAKGPVWMGPSKTSANAIAVVGDTLIVAGAIEIGPNTHDLGVWWVSAETGDLLDAREFAAPFSEDPQNWFDEVARGVAIVDEEVVVVGERETMTVDNILVRRTIVLRHALDGEPVAEWTSPGGLLDEDAGMGIATLQGGGFVVIGWGRDKGSIRQVMTRWFSATGEPIAERIEPTPSSDAIGLAVGEDREGKLIIAGTLQQPKTDANAWIFAIPGLSGPPVWEVVRNGPGQGPDEAAGLAIDAWGYTYVAGSEFDALQPRAFALRLYP